MTNRTIVVGGILPYYLYDRIIKKSSGVIQYAADVLQKALLCGLKYHTENIELYNLPYIGSYPKRYKDLFIGSYDFEHSTPYGTIKSKNIGFCNLSAYKFFSRYYNLKKELNRLFKECNGEEIVLLIYAIHTPFIKACVDIKKKYSNAKIILMVPDLPEYMSSSTSKIRHILNKINNRVLVKAYDNIDGYVLLSKYMTDRIPVGDKPWTVVEGIYDSSMANKCTDINESKDKYILYTGTLARRYGILNLVEAFHNCKLKEVKLYICGEGDSKEIIEEISKRDSRIVYLGQVKREKAIELQRNASLLVNPRTPEGEFTKYSFPSKTMEYLASGIPTLLYKLPGIPDEYYENCFTIDKLGIEAMTESIEKIFSLPDAVRQDKGSKAKLFITSQKNPIEQTRKIINLINNL